MNYIDKRDLHLMYYEVENKKRNKNNVIKVNVPLKTTLVAGDNITTSYLGENKSNYEILEILETRASTLVGSNYVTLKIKYSNK